MFENRLPQVLERDHSMARSRHVLASASQCIVAQMNVQPKVERPLDRQRETQSRERFRAVVENAEAIRQMLREIADHLAVGR